MDTAVRLRGGDPTWVAAASRDDLFAALAEAGCVQRAVDAAVTTCRAELRRRRPEAGCGRNAADEMELRRRTGESTATARRQQRRAEVADRYEAAADRLQHGQLSGEHLDAVATVVPPEMAGAMDADQQAVFAQAAEQTPDEFRSALRHWVEDAERRRGIDRAARQHRRRNGRVRTDPRTGMTEIHAELPPLHGTHTAARIRDQYRRLLAEDHESGDSDRTTAQRWADAITHTLLAGADATPDDRLPVVIVDSHTLCNDDDPDRAASGGQCRIHGSETIATDTARRFICDAPVTVITEQRGVPVAIDTVARRASTAQRRALATIYDTCARPGCDVPYDDCHIHHIRPWTTTHTTHLADLVPVCTTDHHLIHEGGWTLHRTADWTDTWSSPTGHTLTHRPQRAPVTDGTTGPAP